MRYRPLASSRSTRTLRVWGEASQISGMPAARQPLPETGVAVGGVTKLALARHIIDRYPDRRTHVVTDDDCATGGLPGLPGRAAS